MASFFESEMKTRHYEESENPEEKKKFSIDFSRLLYRKSLAFAGVTFFALLVPFIVFLVIFDEGNFSRKTSNICLEDRIYRLPCGEENITQFNCTAIKCCFERSTNSCFHSEPPAYYYYRLKSGVYAPNMKFTPLGLPSLRKLNLTILSESHSLRIILNDTRQSLSEAKISSIFEVHQDENNKLSVSVFRKSTGEMLLTTLKGPLIASDSYLEWTIQLTNTSGVLFGLGGLKINVDENSTLTKVIYKDQTDQNTLPIFMAYNNGKYHAVVIEHEGLLQVTVLPSYLIFMRCIHGRKLELKVIDGPMPKDIYKQFKSSSNLIPEWGLGVHLCREEPAESLSALLQQYETFVENRRGFPEFTFESDCIHDDLFLHLLAENYSSAQVGDIFSNLNLQEKFLLSYLPQIPLRSALFEKYEKFNIFFKNKTQDIYTGKYKGFDVVFPNYEHDNVSVFISDIQKLFEKTNIAGITFSSSWPQDDSYIAGNSTKKYITKEIEKALSYTLPWSLEENGDMHIRYHNEYGPTLEKAVADQFNANLSLFSVPDLHSYSPIIIQNLTTSWTNFKNTLHSTLYNSLFGFDLLATPVCGSNEFQSKSQDELCLRWYLFAATTPIVRISSQYPLRDPTNLYFTYTKNKAIEILNKRASFMPFYRTLLNMGVPVIRPMFYNFPEDEKVHDLDEQYMIGDQILVAQPTASEIEIMKIYLPPDKAWYEFWGGVKYLTTKNAEWIKFPIFKSDWISFISEGNIVAQVEETTGNPKITLTIALNYMNTSEGSLLLNLPNEKTEVSVKFSAKDQNVTITSDSYQDVVRNMITTLKYYTYTGNSIVSGARLKNNIS